MPLAHNNKAREQPLSDIAVLKKSCPWRLPNIPRKLSLG